MTLGETRWLTMANDATELNLLLSQLVLNDQLAVQFADRLTNGDSSDRSLVLYGIAILLCNPVDARIPGTFQQRDLS